MASKIETNLALSALSLVTGVECTEDPGPHAFPADGDPNALMKLSDDERNLLEDRTGRPFAPTARGMSAGRVLELLGWADRVIL